MHKNCGGEMIVRNTETKNRQQNKQTNETATTKRSTTEKKNMNKSSRYFDVLWTRIQIFSYTLISLCSILSVLLLVWLCVYVHFVHLPQSSFYFRFSVASRMTQKMYRTNDVFLPYLNVEFRLTENSEKLQLIRFMNDIKIKNENNFTFYAM